MLNQSNRGLLGNVLALYGLQAVNYLLPLLLMPYLARVLGPTSLGFLAISQALALYVSLFVEYGFNLSATREVARHQNNPRRLSEILAAVLSSRLIIALGIIPFVFVISQWLPIFSENPNLVWPAYFWGVATGFSLSWFFQGLEQMRVVATIEIVARVLGFLCVFLVVKTPDDFFWVLIAQGLAALVAFVSALWLATRHAQLQKPSRSSIIEGLRLGRNIFIFRGTVSLYTSANPLILGMFASPAIVGVYAGAERISKGISSLLAPVSQALFPRLAHQLQHDKNSAVRLAQISLGVQGLGGAAIGFLVFVAAPFWVHLLLGEGYEKAVEALRILALLPPLIALNFVFGVQWMLPQGLDIPYIFITLLGGITNILLALWLVPKSLHIGMSWAVVASELVILLCTLGYLRLTNRLPLPIKRTLI